MYKKYFSTDGIRGITNKSPITPEEILKVGMAAGHFIKRSSKKNSNKVIIGKDTRLSGYMLETALVSGFTAVGLDVTLVGPMPTPAIAILTRSMRVDLGVMITASHNNYLYNGIKFFDHNGVKLDDVAEKEIESLVNLSSHNLLTTPEKIGKANRLQDETGRYIEYIKQVVPASVSLSNCKIVIDCANGAGYQTAPKILWELGAEVIAIANSPNGININEQCGSINCDLLQHNVVKYNADIGIALDGDADRVVICDENGSIIDGDQIIAAIALDLHSRKQLRNNGIVVTQMSNTALDDFLFQQGIKVQRANIGDRRVLAEMMEYGYNFGGEQSGHIIQSDYVATGDGILSALSILSIMLRKKQPASKVMDNFLAYAQIVSSLGYGDDSNFLERKEIKSIVKRYQQYFNDEGRLFIRKSGTEPVIRILMEKNTDISELKKIMSGLITEFEKTSYVI